MTWEACARQMGKLKVIVSITNCMFQVEVQGVHIKAWVSVKGRSILFYDSPVLGLCCARKVFKRQSLASGK